MSDLYNDLQLKTKQLYECVRMLRKSGEDAAAAERDYKCLLRTECLKLRDGGMSGVMIDKICYGIPSVAAARFKRDVCDSVYKANLEMINAVKLEMRLIESQIEREWSAGGNE